MKEEPKKTKKKNPKTRIQINAEIKKKKNDGECTINFKNYSGTFLRFILLIGL